MLGVVPTPSFVSDAVAARLRLFLDRMRGESADYGADAEGLIDSAADTLVGGKRPVSYTHLTLPTNREV